MQSYGFRASRLAYIHEKKYFRIRKNQKYGKPRLPGTCPFPLLGKSAYRILAVQRHQLGNALAATGHDDDYPDLGAGR